MGSVVGKKKKKSRKQHRAQESQEPPPIEPAIPIDEPVKDDETPVASEASSEDVADECEDDRNFDDEEEDNDEGKEEEKEEGEKDGKPETEGSVNLDWHDLEDEDDDDEDEKEKYVAPSEIVKQILNGDINLELPPQVRVVRIFTSSTFTDTFHERNTLMVKVYPKLKEYCQSQGYDFQVVDMRWGVRDEATADHMTSELCMRELRACQKLSTGPNFITFLGQKYGYRPFPPKIIATEFDAMFQIISNQADKDLLTKWFYLDSNTIPATYILQPITDLLPSYNNRSASKDEQSKASSDWWTAFERMQIVFRQAASKALKQDKNAMWKFFMSVTEDEINRGLLKAKEPLKHCYWFKRNITDIHDYVQEYNTRNFIDKLGPNLDTEANDLVESLRNEKIPKVLTQDKISVYDIHWQTETGIDPQKSNQHASYLDLLCEDFHRILVNMIKDGVKERESFNIDDSLIKEICQHATTCKDKSRVFHGREDVLEKIETYLSSDAEENEPLVVHGPSGCGKTSIISKAALLAKEQHDKLQITRFLGTTSDSSTLSKLLYNVCCQLKRAIGASSDSVPTSSKKLTECLKEIIESLVKNKTEVILFLDSIDQLAPDDGAYLMKWLPKKLPSCVKFVISTLPDEKYQILSNLKNVLPESSFVEVPQLPSTTANDILTAWLSDASRKLTDEQTKIVMDAFERCPLPLFLKLCFDEAVRWKSYTKHEDTVLESNIKDAINTLFARLERLHGKALVSHALGLITTSKHGLTDAEIDEILSIDDEVLNDVYQYWTPPVRRIPPLLWVRVRSDLGSYIVSRGANSSLVNMWYHRQFTETATERYLQAKDKQGYHVLLSEYFRGIWSNSVMKPFTSKDGKSDESDRLVSAQPNVFSNENSADGLYNYRKLSELPRHLIASNNMKYLKAEILFNFDFLLAKLKAFGYQYLLEDCEEATQQFPNDKDIKLIEEFFKMSGRTLLADPKQLPGQLVGRLNDILSDDILSLLEQAKASNAPCLYPVQRVYDAPGGPIIHSLAGHTQAVNFAIVTNDKKRLISSSNDSTVRIWDLSTGRQLRCIDCEETINLVFPFQNDTCVILTTYSKVLSQNVQSEEIYYNEYHSSSYGNSADMTKNEEHFLLLAEEDITVFDCKDKCISVNYTVTESAEKTEDALVDFITAGADVFAFTRKVKDYFFVRKASDKAYKKKLKSPSTIVYFTFSEDGSKFVLLSTPSSLTEAYKTTHLHIYDPSSWNVMKKFEGMDSHTILYVTSVSMSGDEFIWPAMMQINFWNIETGRERQALKSGYQGNQFKQAVPGLSNSLVVISMDQSNPAMQVYNTDLIDYKEITVESANMTDIEKGRAYVGKGEREMFMHPTVPTMAVSIPPMDSFLNFYDTTTYKQTRKLISKDIYPNFINLVDERHLHIWDHSKKTVLTVDFIDGKVVGSTPYPLSDYPPSLYMNTWVLLRQTKELLMFDEHRQFFQIFDWTTGEHKGDIQPEWNGKKGQHILSNKDGSLILSCETSDDDYTKSHPLMVFDTVKRVKICEIKQEGRMDMRPEVAVLSLDGKYFACTSVNTDAVNVYNVQDGTLVTSLQYVVNEYSKGNVMSLCISSQIRCIIVCYMASVPVQNSSNYERQNLLVAYHYENWEKLAEIKAKGMVGRFHLSRDETRFLTDVRGGGEDQKTLTLYDLSKVVCDKIIIEIGSIVPETDTRFSYLTQDGQSVGVGLAGIDGVVFFRPCGAPEIVTETPDYTEINYEYTPKDKK